MEEIMDNGDQMILKCLREILTVFLWPVHVIIPDVEMQETSHKAKRFVFTMDWNSF